MSPVLSAIVAASALLGAPQEKQIPWPTADAVAKARRDVAELYGDRLAKAKKPCDKVALGRELLKVAGETADDSAAQFTLCYTARNLGVEAKDWALTAEAIAAVVNRFKVEKPTEPAEQIRRGDALCEEAKKKKATADRLAARLEAAEWYSRAKQTGKGLQVEIADRRLADLVELVGCRKNGDDLRLLVGTWDVQVGDKYRGTWEFRSDGTVLKDGRSPGKWTADSRQLKIVWDDNAWESFFRPLNAAGTKGDSIHGAGILRAQKPAIRR